jgi:endonuclease G
VLDRGAGADAVDATPTTYAVIMPNSTTVSGTRWPEYQVSIDEVERQTGYDFLTLVPETIQRSVEARSVTERSAGRARSVRSMQMGVAS